MGTCTALNLSDSSKCTEPTTNKTGLHAHQVQGLYQGYKHRSQELDALEEKQPASLPKSLSTTDFSSINDSEILTAIHVFLLKKFKLTNRCLTARDYHHSHSYISESVLLRLIIANPSILTTAIASPSIDDFFHNTTNVRNTDLRDLGLDLSCPSLKLMKSAYLDYWVAEAMKGQDNVESQDKGKRKDGTARSLLKKLHPDRLALWRDNKVKVCGKWVYNPPYEFTLPRDG